MKPTVPYTYHIYHPPTGKHYYGSRYAAGCHPSDLGVSYFSSSKMVKELISLYHISEFVFEVRKTFLSAAEAISWEQRVLRRMKVLQRDDWLNMNINGSAFTQTPEGRDRISRSKLKYWANTENRSIQSLMVRESWSNDINRKKNLSERNKLMWNNPEYRARMIEMNKTRERKPSELRNKRVEADGLIFNSLNECSLHFNKSRVWVYKKIKSGIFKLL